MDNHHRLLNLNDAISDDYTAIDIIDAVDGSDGVDDVNNRHQINPYIRYFLTLEVCQFFFALGMTAAVIAFCAYKVATIPEDSPHFSLYFTPMMSLLMVWIPVRNVRKKIANVVETAVSPTLTTTFTEHSTI